MSLQLAFCDWCLCRLYDLILQSDSGSDQSEQDKS